MMAKGIAKSLRTAGRNKYIKHQKGQSIDKELLKSGNVKPNELPDAVNKETIDDIRRDLGGKLVDEFTQALSNYGPEAQETADRFDRLEHIGHAGVLVGELARLGAPRSLIEKIAPTDPNNIYDYELASAIAQSFHTDLFSTAEDFDRYLELSGYSQLSRKGAVASYETFNITGDKTLATAGAAHAIDPTQPSVTEFVSLQGEYLGVTPYDYPQNTPLYDLDALNAFLAQNRMAGEHVNAVAYAQHMPGYARLQAELQRAGAPASLLESLAKGSGASAFNKSGVNPSMAAAMMRGLEGASVVNDVRFSALDKLAGEHARLEYERTGDAVAATQAGVDAVRAAKEANTGQAPLSGLSNEQVAEKAVQGYRDSLMKGTLQIDQYGRVTRGSLADKNPNYAGPSHEFSPEDYMTFEQNQQQLARNEAKRLAAKTQREAPKATAKAPPKTPRTVMINVPRQDYLSGQTQQGAARAARSKIDTTGLNVDLLNKAVPKTRPGQYEVTLGGWSPVGGSPAAVQKTAPKPKSDPDLLAAAQRTDRQLAQQARINKAAAQVRAREDRLLRDTSKASRASAKEDTLDDVDLAVDITPNAKAAKVDKLGESVKVHGLELIGENAVSKAQEEQERREQNVRQRREKSGQTSNDNVSSIGAGSQAGRDAASQISMGETSGRSTGYNDRQDLATALSRSGQHGDVGVSDLTSHGTIRGSQQSNMLAEQDKGLFGDSDSSGSSSRVICTELVRQGLMAPRLQRLDIAYTLRHLPPATVRGYHAWAVPYVRLMKRSNLATRLVEPLARWRAEEISFRMKSRSRPHYRGRVVRWLGEPVCWLLGTALGWVGDPDRFYPQPKADQNKI